MTVIALVGLATGFALTRRLERVTEAARQFTAGNTAARSKISGYDEVALLSRNVDLMAEFVSEQQARLREQGDGRSDLRCRYHGHLYLRQSRLPAHARLST